MAISLSTAYTSPRFSQESSHSVSPSRTLSSISSVRLPAQIRRFGIRHESVQSPSSSTTRFAKLTVRAKKQTFNSFDDLLQNSDKPLLVDFYATWCGPCQLMVPILNEVSETLKDKIAVVKIDTEKYPSLANKYQIEALPTFILFKDGKLWDRFVRTVRYGPKVIARSIKRIKSGEEITVSYIDLLQPTGLRQSDLWSKYRFMCNCGRCAASPPAYVDSVLEGVLVLKPEETTVDYHHGTTNKDEAVAKMTDYIQEAIDDFLSDNIDPKTCCEKIDNVLHHGIQFKADSQPHCLQLHACHYVALNAYITLATAYRIRSIDSETGIVFDMSRISAAYSFFLACASHLLFSAEPCLAISAANFWKNAGESLLDLASKFPLERSVQSDVKCTKCLMLGTSNLHREIKEKSRQILSCVTDISQVIWSFLTRGCPYLQKFWSPVDFSLTRINGERKESIKDQTVNVLLLSFHCLLYADLLADLCYGEKSHLVS